MEELEQVWGSPFNGQPFLGTHKGPGYLFFIQASAELFPLSCPNTFPFSSSPPPFLLLLFLLLLLLLLLPSPFVSKCYCIETPGTQQAEYNTLRISAQCFQGLGVTDLPNLFYSNKVSLGCNSCRLRFTLERTTG